MNRFPRNQSLSDLLYSTKRKKKCNGNSNGGRWPTFAGNSAPLPSDVIGFCTVARSESFGGKQFYCYMSCEIEITNGSARCWGKSQLYNNGILSVYSLELARLSNFTNFIMSWHSRLLAWKKFLLDFREKNWSSVLSIFWPRDRKGLLCEINVKRSKAPLLKRTRNQIVLN